MNFDLAAMIRRTRNPRRSQIVLRPIIPTAALASDLYTAAYKPIITAWQRGIERIAAEYERSVVVRDGAALVLHRQSAGQITDAMLTDSIFDLEGILSSIGEELQRLVIGITPALRQWAVRMEGWQRGKWQGAVLTATGIDLGTILSPYDVNDTVQTSIASNVSLIRSISDEARGRVSEIVLRNYQNRTPAREVARELDEAVGLSRKRALRVAADQSSKLANRLDQARQEQAGIDRFKWRWSHKKHGRAIHIAHDGKIYAWNDPPQSSGKPDLPGQLPYCGCRAQAVLSLD